MAYNIRVIMLTAAVLFLSIGDSLGQDYINKLKKWDDKEKYRKVVRKANRYAKKYPDDAKIFYYASAAELKLSLQSEKPRKGFKHLMKSVEYYEKYSLTTEPVIGANKLKNSLHSELVTYKKHYQKNKKKKQLIDDKISSTFSNKLGDPKPPPDNESTQKGEPKVDKSRQKIITEAKKHLGKSYLYGGKGPDKFDCSGFTRFVYMKAADIELPPNSVMQSRVGRQVSAQNAKPGDLIFFGDPITKNINHVGIVVSVSKREVTGMIHSSSSRGVVIDKENETWNSHWKKRIVRIVNVLDYNSKDL